MSWQFPIPYRSPDEPVVNLFRHARALDDPEDRAVVRELATAALSTVTPEGFQARTIGDVLDIVEHIEPHERRALLDNPARAGGAQAHGQR